MKTSKIIERGIFIVVIILLIGVILGNKPVEVQNNPNQPNDYKPVMYYNPKTSKIFAQGYQIFTYGLDSSIYTVDVKNGKNKFYFVLYDMSVEFTVTKYNE